MASKYTQTNIPPYVDTLFEKTGGVYRSLHELLYEYQRYAETLLALNSLKVTYIELTKQKDESEKVDKLSNESRGLRREIAAIGNEITFLETPIPKVNLSGKRNLAQIGNAMVYRNPAAWISYKAQAYLPEHEINQRLNVSGIPVSQPITTVSDLINHSLGTKGYICGRRLHFLARQYVSIQDNELALQIGVLNPWQLTHADTPLFTKIFERLGLETNLNQLLLIRDFILECARVQSDWQSFELNSKGKWQTYSVDKNEI
jgi:hypothetical protein